jgi:Ser-tRNA(Ala) deacylase AlaX
VALYLEDASLLQATATVLGVEQSEKGWTVALDATPFHPQGGGQPADVGTCCAVESATGRIRDRCAVAGKAAACFLRAWL